MTKMVKKCSTGQSCIPKEVTSYKIHTLAYVFISDMPLKFLAKFQCLKLYTTYFEIWKSENPINCAEIYDPSVNLRINFFKFIRHTYIVWVLAIINAKACLQLRELLDFIWQEFKSRKCIELHFCRKSLFSNSDVGSYLKLGGQVVM